MSDALEYLMRVRPAAMQSYFDFVRASGTHLDPRTRAIISLITKVHAQTDAGFRQYLVRALRAGVGANEVLDALLAAFPALGLSRIIWAMDILLEMDIPEFRPENLETLKRWHDLLGEEELEDGVRHLNRDGRDLFIHSRDGSIIVYDARCPHQATNIPAGAAVGNVLACPKHGWKFDLESGDCIERGDRPLKRIEHKLEDGRLLACW